MTDKEYIENLEGRIKKMQDFWKFVVGEQVVPNAQRLFDENRWGLLCIVPKGEYEKMVWKLVQLERGGKEDAVTRRPTIPPERRVRTMEWISVDERLPEKITNKVLVFCKNGYIGFGHYEKFQGVEDWYNLESGKPFREWDLEDCETYDVTHWMPLPPPPPEQ